MTRALAAPGANLEDTTNDPDPRPCAGRLPWLDWQRSEDYYSEGELIWLDADTLIRQLSGGKRSLDDFARSFFGVDNVLRLDHGQLPPSTTWSRRLTPCSRTTGSPSCIRALPAMGLARRSTGWAAAATA